MISSLSLILGKETFHSPVEVRDCSGSRLVRLFHLGLFRVYVSRRLWWCQLTTLVSVPWLRASYLIWGAQCKMKMRDLLIKKWGRGAFSFFPQFLSCPFVLLFCFVCFVFILLFNATLPRAQGYSQDECRPPKRSVACWIWLHTRARATLPGSGEGVLLLNVRRAREAGRVREAPSSQPMLHCPIGLHLKHIDLKITPHCKKATKEIESVGSPSGRGPGVTALSFRPCSPTLAPLSQSTSFLPERGQRALSLVYRFSSSPQHPSPLPLSWLR